jgi:hypothetical protein
LWRIERPRLPPAYGHAVRTLELPVFEFGPMNGSDAWDIR